MVPPRFSSEFLILSRLLLILSVLLVSSPASASVPEMCAAFGELSRDIMMARKAKGISKDRVTSVIKETIPSVLAGMTTPRDKYLTTRVKEARNRAMTDIVFGIIDHTYEIEIQDPYEYGRKINKECDNGGGNSVIFSVFLEIMGDIQQR